MESELLDESLIAVLMLAELCEDQVSREQLVELARSGVNEVDPVQLLAIMRDESAVCGDRCLASVIYMACCSDMTHDSIEALLRQVLAMADGDELAEAAEAHTRLKAAKGIPR